MSSFPAFCCPRCKGPLDSATEAYLCDGCDCRYPIVFGIPDFRVFPDLGLDHEERHDDLAPFAAQEDKLDFKGLLLANWADHTSARPELAKRFIRRALTLVERGSEDLRQIESQAQANWPDLMGASAMLEIGCGTGGFLIVAKERFENVVGIDLDLRRLILARKRASEFGLTVPLLRAFGEYLPFPDNVFDLVVADNVIEHVNDQRKTVRESGRVLNRDGFLFMATPNRFSITPEPHVRVWGVGFLPRRWMRRYVQFMKGSAYDQIRNLSFFELNRMMNQCAFTDHRILLPSIPQVELQTFSKLARFQIGIYDLMKRIPLIRLLLYLFGPFFQIMGRPSKTASGSWHHNPIPTPGKSGEY